MGCSCYKDLKLRSYKLEQQVSVDQGDAAIHALRGLKAPVVLDSTGFVQKIKSSVN